MSISEAINDLKIELAADGYSDDLVELVAEEWDLNPILLERKFREACGCGVVEWTPPAPVKERNLESLRPAAEKWYNEQFRGSGAEIGSTFTRGERRGFIVAITTSKVYYIDALNEQRRVITFRNSAHRASWVDRSVS